MEPNKISRIWQQGHTVQVEALDGVIFTGEADAHTFVVSGKDATGGAVPITGTITAKFLNSAQSTTPLTGTVADGVASVTLTDDCYKVPGRFVLTIYATNGNSTICLYAGVGNVFRSSSDIISYPTEALPDLVQLVADVQAAISSVPADYSAVLAAMASPFDSTKAYAAGAYVWNNGTLYRFTADHAAGAWIGTDATPAALGSDISDLKSALGTAQGQITDNASDIADLQSTITSVTKKMREVPRSVNVWDPAKEKTGYFVAANGAEGEGSSFVCYSEPIPVQPGDIVRFYKLDGATFAAANARFICAYDINENAVSASGVNAETNSYTVPSGIYSINPTQYTRWTKRMMTINAEATEFDEYAESYYVAGDEFVEYSATSEDVGKAFSPKIVVNGKVKEWQYVEAGGSRVEIDDTLSQAGEAADAKAAGDAIGEKVSVSMMQLCDTEIVPGSKNLWDSVAAQNGFVATNGAIYSSDTYCYNYVDVTPGDKVYCSIPGELRNMRFICACNEYGEAVPASGSGSDTNGYTVPSGIVKLAITITSSIKDTAMVILNEANAPVSFIPHVAPSLVYVAKEEFLKNTSSMTEGYFRNEYMEVVETNILDPEEAVTKKLIIYNSGALIDVNDYYTTGYMPVKERKTYYFFTNKLNSRGARAIAAFDSGKTNVPSAGINDGSSTTYSYTVPTGIAFIRISFAYRTNDITFQPGGNMVIALENPTAFLHFSDEEEYVFKPSYIPDIVPGLHVYLPDEICVGIGRTIELYNDLVCLEASKYHMHYSCSVGVQYARKFSIVGATAGTYPLTLQIYNDNEEMIWRGTSSVKVVANSITNRLKILPIGDSLTNLKAWLNEVQNLSNDKILYIGTRGRNDSEIRCEGRSGFTAADYLANTSYTFDTNYQGNPNVQGSVNPFWDGSRFSLTYYNTQQAATVGTADAIEILLGTNDVFSGDYTAEECAEHITNIVDEIRQDDANIPIFVCNTIYRSNQNGYYSSGGQGFSAASGWAFDSDMRIMAFQNTLVSAIKAKNYTSVYIVPCSVCMDRDNDFGQVEVAVNPRLQDVTVNIPFESVHPQNAGYYQMADVMYSSFIAHLS